MKIVCVIPARSGSKRIKDKNIIDFDGKPMIAHTIEAAIESRQFDNVFVATDCESIAEISRNYGAEVPFLRTIDADDFTPISVATINFVSRLEGELGLEYDVVCQAMANCPMRKAIDFVNAVEFHISSKNVSTISGMRYGMFNPLWAYFKDSQDNYKLLFENVKDKRSQDLVDLICPTGAIWLATKKNLVEERTFYMECFKFFELNWISGLDIDTHDDLKIARLIVKLDER